MKKIVINEEFLQQIETLQTILKNNISGMFGGNRKSKKFGSSCEFADYRNYVPGDDITKIDWNAYARFDKLYMKLFLDERQMHTKIYIDASRSMDHGEGGKAEQSVKLAAFIAYLSVCEMDRVSVYVIKDKKVHEVISSVVGKDAYFESVSKLNDIVFDGDSFISDAIVPTSVGYGDGMSVIISDFLTENNFEDAIDLLTDKKRDVLCVQVLSIDELNPDIRGKVHLIDSEDEEKFYHKNVTRDIAKAYRDALDYVINRVKNYCEARSAAYLLLSAEMSLAEIFMDKLVSMEVVK